jgi:nicotinamide-nucleotide amidase
VIAEWTKDNLVFHEPSWAMVQERLTSRGFTVKEMQRQQCYFPSQAIVLPNSQGTANGFRGLKATDSAKVHYIILPGPPREIEALWRDHIATWARTHLKNLDPKITRSWDTLGLGESDIASLVNEALAKTPVPPQNLEVGYRVHLPYVEVKLTYRRSAQSAVSELIAAVDLGLTKVTVLRDFADAAELVARRLATGKTSTPFAFYDFVSHGFLHHRLSPHLKSVKTWLWKQSLPEDAPTVDFFNDEQEFLALLPQTEDTATLIIDHAGRRLQKLLEAPMKSPLMKERRGQYFAECALIELAQLTP